MTYLVAVADWDYTPPTAGLGASEFNQTPLEGYLATLAAATVGANSDRLPISEPTYPGAAGARSTTWADDLLERIHVTPGALAFGNIIGNAQRTISVWNAFTTRAVRLDSVGSTGVGGVTLSGQPAPPLDFAPLQERQYTAEATPAGPPVLAGGYSFAFSTGDVRAVALSGRRIIAWQWAPDWSRGILERLEWRTEVLRTYNAREQRRRIRRGARRIVEFDVLVTERDRRLFETAGAGWQARTWALPLWWSGRALSAPIVAGATSIPISTANSDFAVGELAIILAPDGRNEVVEVASISAGSIGAANPTLAAWDSLARVFPAVSARLDASVSLARFDGSSSYFRARLTATQPAEFAGAPPATTFLGYPVLAVRPLLGGEIAVEQSRKLEEFDPGIAAPYVDDEGGLALFSQSHGWLATTEAECAALRGLLFYLQGRFGAVWLPTWAEDLRVVADIGSASPSIDVERTGFGLYLNGNPGRNHVAIYRRDGGVTYHRITGAADVNATTERLSIAPAYSTATPASDIVRVSFLSLMRLAGDGLELLHWTGDSLEVAASFASFRHDL